MSLALRDLAQGHAAQNPIADDVENLPARLYLHLYPVSQQELRGLEDFVLVLGIGVKTRRAEDLAEVFDVPSQEKGIVSGQVYQGMWGESGLFVRNGE